MEIILFILGVWLFITGEVRFAGKTSTKIHGRLLGVALMFSALFVFSDLLHFNVVLVWVLMLYVYVQVDKILTYRQEVKDNPLPASDSMEGKECSRNWLWKKEGYAVTLFPNLKPGKNKNGVMVDPHSSIGKPFLVIVIIMIVYGYFHVNGKVPVWLDWVDFVAEYVKNRY